MIKEAVASVALDKGQTQTFSEDDRKESTLSDKIIEVLILTDPIQDIPDIIYAKDVKKCFKKLKEDLCLQSEIPSCEECLVCKTINERVGDKLK